MAQIPLACQCHTECSDPSDGGSAVAPVIVPFGQIGRCGGRLEVQVHVGPLVGLHAVAQQPTVEADDCRRCPVSRQKRERDGGETCGAEVPDQRKPPSAASLSRRAAGREGGAGTGVGSPRVHRGRLSARVSAAPLASAELSRP